MWGDYSPATSVDKRADAPLAFRTARAATGSVADVMAPVFSDVTGVVRSLALTLTMTLTITPTLILALTISPTLTPDQALHLTHFYLSPDLESGPIPWPLRIPTTYYSLLTTHRE